jgi:hypothetical protein
MNKKIIGIILIVISVVIGAYVLVVNKGSNITNLTRDEIAWAFPGAGTDKETGAVLTNVKVTIRNKSYDAGTYLGTCRTLEPAGLESNEVAGVICWFAGAGDEIGIFKEGEKYFIKHGELSEGSEEEPGFRGNFEILHRL